MRSLLQVAALFLISFSVWAHDEVLSFRLNSRGQVEAVVAGLLFGDACRENPRVGRPDTITIAGTTIDINSLLLAVPAVCTPGPPGVTPYEVVAVLGPLAGPSYDVFWTTSTSRAAPKEIVFSATLVIAALTLPVPVPISTAAPISSCILLLVAGIYWSGMVGGHGTGPKPAE